MPAMAELSRAELKYHLERQRDEIKTLNEYGKLLSATTEPQQIMQQTSTYLQSVFPVSALCIIWSLEQRQMMLAPFAPLPEVELDTAVRQVRHAAEQALGRLIPAEDSVTQSHAWPARAGQPTTRLRANATALLNVKGQVIGLLSLFSGQADAFTNEDRHAISIVADQLAAALRNAYLVTELRRADELKDQLLSVVSHELGTPLTAIKEGVGMVIDGSLGTTTPDQVDFLKTVLENAERLERLVDKVKTASELIAGQVSFAFESFDLRTLVAGVEKTYRPMAKLKKVVFKVMEAPKPVFWQVDPKRLAQAVGQLVENGIQAAPPEGYVTISISATAFEAELRIQDTGEGIAKDALPTVMGNIEQLPSLFDRFQSLGGIHDRKMGGLGLGLFIAKSMVEGHGGAIAVESARGEGTSMTIRLPKEPPAAARRSVTPAGTT